MSTEKMGMALDKYGEEDLLSMLVRYGLFIGAIFQFVCMASAVLMSSNDAGDDAQESEGQAIAEPGPANAARRFHKLRKLEKKKRR